ncbi:cellulase family glycosylhydrolase [Candidatus Saccharibacteria bacterium]|nr:cellulase family glycosylhydrolase [Candidatus Saccharibacteria bacterium]
MKNKSSNWQLKIKKLAGKHRTKMRSFIIIISIGVVGAIVLVITKAAVPFASLESEKGNSITAQILNGNGASGNQYIKFSNLNSGNSSTGKFYIVGNQIIDPDGNIFYPVGSNVAVRQASWAENGFVFNYFGTATGKSTDVQRWGWNTLRVTMVCNTGNPSQGDTLNGINALVDEYTVKKIVLMFECHDVTLKNPAYNDGAVQGVMSLFDELANRYKNNPYVWFNPVNEPFSNTDINTWVNFQNNLYNRIRSRAPDNIFVADLAGGGNNVDHLVDSNMHNTFGSGKCNILYGWHSYGFIGGFANDAKHKTYIEALNQRKIPVIIGELGDPLRYDGQPLTAADPAVAGVAGNPDQNRIGARALINYGPSNNIGLLWWHATGDSNSSSTYSLTKDKTSPWTVNANNASSKLSVSGKMFWDLSQKNHNKGKFTGNVANSGCASAK